MLRHEQSPDVRLTLGDIVKRYSDAHPNKNTHYLKALRESEVPAANSTTVKLDAKPMADITTADIEHAAKAWRERPRAKRGVRGGTDAARHLLFTARHLFNWAIKKGHATHTLFRREGVTCIEVPTSGHAVVDCAKARRNAC